MSECSHVELIKLGILIAAANNLCDSTASHRNTARANFRAALEDFVFTAGNSFCDEEIAVLIRKIGLVVL